MSSRQRPWTHKHNQNKRRMSDNDRRESEDIIEHRPGRRQVYGSTIFGQRPRQAMILASFLGVIYLVYSWTNGGDAARLAWQKEPVWHESWCVIIWGTR